MNNFLSESSFETLSQIQKKTSQPFCKIIEAIKEGLKNGSVVGKQFDEGEYSYPAFRKRNLFDFET
jgi:hypothetical protein